MTTTEAILRDPNADDLPFEPGVLGGLAQQIETLRTDILFGVEEAGACPFAEQHYLLALGHLEQAGRAMRLAQLHQARALAQR